MILPPLIVYSSTFIAVTSLFLLCLGYWTRYDRQIDNRIAGLSPGTTTKRVGTSRPAKNRHSKEGLKANATNRLAIRLLPNNLEERQRLQSRLLNAGIYSPQAVTLYLSAKIVLTCLPPIAGFALGALGWLNPSVGLFWGSAIGIPGLVLPSLWLRIRKRTWHTMITRSLADFLDLMVACLEVGLSVEAALQRVTEELRHAHPQLSVELSVVQAQIELGASSDVALQNFADRSDCDAIRAVASVVQQGRRLGGGVADVFRQQADYLRVRREHLAEEKAQQAAVKIVLPTLLFIFPVIFVVLAGPAVIKLAEMFEPKSSFSRSSR